MRPILATLVAATLALPAQAFTAENMLQVNPLPQHGTFEVVGDPGSGARDFWCAAGQYATMKLGLGANDRVYILKGFARSQTSPASNGVAFSITPTPQTTPTPKYNISMKNIGFSLHTALATSFCADYIEDMF